jgi:hypothetical protein
MFRALVVILVLALPACARADTLSLAVSPTTPLAGSSFSLTVSGSASAGESLTTAIEATESLSSPGTCPAGETFGYGDAELAPSLPHTYSRETTHGSGTYRACAYLLTEHIDANYTVDAIAETRFAVQDQAEREASEQAQVEGREVEELYAVERRADATPVAVLSVHTIARVGTSTAHPGETELVITTAPFAQVTITLTRHGRRRVERFDVGTSSLTATTAAVTPTINWSCAAPGGTYHYVVTARTDVGRSLARSGHFSPVSAAHCRLLKRRETEARQRNARRYAESVAQHEREEREALEQWEENCRALGGTPVTLHTSEGNERACRAPNGGRISVPS